MLLILASWLSISLNFPEKLGSIDRSGMPCDVASASLPQQNRILPSPEWFNTLGIDPAVCLVGPPSLYAVSSLSSVASASSSSSSSSSSDDEVHGFTLTPRSRSTVFLYSFCLPVVPLCPPEEVLSAGFFNDVSVSFDEAAGFFNDVSVSFDEAAGFFNDVSVSFDEAAGFFNDVSVSFDEAAGFFNDVSVSFDEAAGFFNDVSVSFDEAAGFFNDVSVSFDEAAGFFNDVSVSFDEAAGFFNDVSVSFDEATGFFNDVSKPAASSNDTETSLKKPAASSNDTETSLKKPAASSNDTETSLKKPAASSNDTETSLKKPAASSNDTETSLKKPAASSNDTETSLKKPGASSHETKPSPARQRRDHNTSSGGQRGTTGKQNEYKKTVERDLGVSVKPCTSSSEEDDDDDDDEADATEDRELTAYREGGPTRQTAGSIPRVLNHSGDGKMRFCCGKLAEATSQGMPLLSMDPSFSGKLSDMLNHEANMKQHVASVLTQKNVNSTKLDAKTQCINNGKPAYIPCLFLILRRRTTDKTPPHHIVTRELGAW
ncbi:hypothetical protein NP493_8979g00000 [Ridgeia piscesae]|uniref:Uncharacterized protein n=1 Tax=Ridgeia piscesae TaxID=27915 RepID=A0AAD9MJ42_RIDPI|nr:hypothetical protein NP493_8979g00000 [Ridgeia piscesae]